jgi:hypothetical protein
MLKKTTLDGGIGSTEKERVFVLVLPPWTFQHAAQIAPDSRHKINLKQSLSHVMRCMRVWINTSANVGYFEGMSLESMRHVEDNKTLNLQVDQHRGITRSTWKRHS